MSWPPGSPPTARATIAAACLCAAFLSLAARATEPAAAEPPAAPSFANPRDVAVQGTLARLGLSARIEAVAGQDTAFLTLLTPPRAPRLPLGAVLLVPAAAAALCDPLILALAREPPAGGWLTLAVQTPAVKQASEAEFCARLTASLAHLKSRDKRPVVLAGIGGGADAALACFAGKLPSEVVAFAGIGRWRNAMQGLDLPVLDLFPATDGIARAAANGRSLRAESRAPGTYLPIAVEASDDFFVGGEQEVAKRLRGWLSQLPAPARTASK